jgi:ATP-dependent DNA ligase
VLATPPVYVTFDVLYAQGEDIRGRPLAARREMLEEIVDGAGSVFVAPRLSTNGHEAWAEVQRLLADASRISEAPCVRRTGRHVRHAEDYTGAHPNNISI